MEACRFGVRELYAGNRFQVPVSEASLIEAGRAAGLRAGETLLELGCGMGAAAVFLAEEFHVYARGVDGDEEWIAEARERARRSPAAHRVRFHAGEPPGGPVDVLCSLRGARGHAAGLLREGGRWLLGRFVLVRTPAPAEIARHFPLEEGDPEGEVVWRRVAAPLEWERFLSPQERALRVYRRGVRTGEEVSRIARLAESRIATFRSHGSFVGYELLVLRVG